MPLARHGAERFGLTQVQLGQLLIKRGVAGAPVPVHFVECSLEQAAGHCEEIMGRWRVDARPVVLEPESDLPAGVVVATYFHYNDIRQKWPDRVEGVRFVAIAPDPALAGALDAGAGEGGPRRLRVCELEESKAVNIAADLSVLLPPERYTLEPYVLRSPSSLPRRRPGEELLVAPRVWGAMDGRTRRQVKLIRYRIRPFELEALGESFGWRPSLGRGIA